MGLDKPSPSHYSKYNAETDRRGYPRTDTRRPTKTNKGNDKEEYMRNAARESRHMLKGSFGEESWKVALEPEC